MVMAESQIIRIGYYDIIRTIGKGNFASVKLARHRITKSEVAIKIIEKFRLDQSDLNKIYREIQILKLLRHPHIMKLYEVIETKTKIHLVCEYASHGEVFDYITQEEKIPEEKARKLFYQVLTAVEYCHKHNVVHRDLKAENLLLDAHDNIKLADFGFGNFFQSGQNLNTWCGSPPYAAPEVFEGKLYEGPQLDIWSLGIVLYVLVCGTFPFDGSNLATLKERVLAGRFRIPYWMSQDCENLIRRMLVVNPKKRLTIAQIKKHRWLEPVAVKPDTTLRKCDSPSRRSAGNQLPEYNELILKQIQTLGIDRQKTLEALRTSSYNHLYAIYHLLVDRLKNHRTSVPLETKLSYDGGKRRPSNIVEQTVTKRSFTSSPTSKLSDQFRNAQISHRLNTYHHPQLRASNSARSADEHSHDSYVTTQHRDVKFVEDTGNDLPAIQRSLLMGAFQVPHISQPPVSPSAVNKPKYITHPSRGPLPHQPWSFNAGLGIRATYQTSPPHPLVVGQHQRGSGDVIPSVTSIDEGVELRSTSPSEQEMIKLANQHPRRHTLGIPESYLPFAHLACKSGEIASQTSAVGDGSRADSLYGSSGIGNAQDVDAQAESLDMSCDSTPRVVLSPCTDESSPSPQPQESRVTYVENQRQLLDVSPTGFREGRRASDGLLLLGDNRIGEHLKKICRANQFPPITQEENDDSCFDGTEKEQENKRRNLLRVMPDMRTYELGAMSSYSSQHVMQFGRSDVINFQPYASSNRRCGLLVPQSLTEERCSSYSKGFEAPLVRQHAAYVQPGNQVLHQSYDQADDDHTYQWSSWKAVTEKELPDSDNLQHRRDTIPFLNRTNIGTGAFTVWSDDAVSKKSSLDYSARQAASGQSLVQVLQRRRINRRRHIAQHVGSSSGSSNYQLPELELLRIVDGNFSNPGSTEELSGRFPTQSSVLQPFTTGSLEGYRGNSPDLQQNIFTDQRDHSVLVTTPHLSNPFQGQTNGGFSSWTETSNQSNMFHTNAAMEFS